jgi:hypothetical protein
MSEPPQYDPQSWSPSCIQEQHKPLQPSTILLLHHQVDSSLLMPSTDLEPQLTEVTQTTTTHPDHQEDHQEDLQGDHQEEHLEAHQEEDPEMQ